MDTKSSYLDEMYVLMNIFVSCGKVVIWRWKLPDVVSEFITSTDKAQFLAENFLKIYTAQFVKFHDLQDRPNSVSPCTG